jgi:hypothetical protein
LIVGVLSRRRSAASPGRGGPDKNPLEKRHLPHVELVSPGDRERPVAARAQPQPRTRGALRDLAAGRARLPHGAPFDRNARSFVAGAFDGGFPREGDQVRLDAGELAHDERHRLELSASARVGGFARDPVDVRREPGLVHQGRRASAVPLSIDAEYGGEPPRPR